MYDLGVIFNLPHDAFAWWWCQKLWEVHICVDLKPLNLNELREVYPLPAVGKTLVPLTGAAAFSKLCANSGKCGLYNKMCYLFHKPSLPGCFIWLVYPCKR